MIKLGIGAIHGAGKTTLIYNIKNYLESLNKTVYIVDEIARSCPHPLETIESQRWIWENQLLKEIKAQQSNCDIILCDRTLLDNLLYYKYLLNNQFDPIFELLIEYTKKWMNTYSYISVLPLNLNFIKNDINDKIRITNVDKTIKINKLFKKYLNPYMNININQFNYKKQIGVILNENNM